MLDYENIKNHYKLIVVDLSGKKKKDLDIDPKATQQIEFKKTKIRNAFANNMLINKKLSKAQSSTIIQSGGFCGAVSVKNCWHH